MKRKVFSSVIGGLLIGGGVIFNVSINSNKSNGSSDISLANVEALTGELKKKVTTTCAGTNTATCTTPSGAISLGPLTEVTEYYD